MNSSPSNTTHSPEADSSVLPSGTLLHGGAFTIQSVLGKGGFGITYRGVDVSLQRPVAIKEFFPPGSMRQRVQVSPPQALSDDQFAAARNGFGREASTLARFNNSGIVHIFRVFEENNTTYIVMEFLEGQTLGQRLHAGALPVGEVVEMARSIGQALHTIHGARLLHRDIKPDNIFLTNDKRAVLIDFGTAREYSDAVRAMTALVTHGYAPLEQYGSTGKFGPYTDIYGLGATLYHALTGQAPAPPPDRLTGTQLPSPEQINRDIAPAVGQVVMHALQIQSSQRPQSVHEFVGKLRQAHADSSMSPPVQPIPAASPGPAPTPHTSSVPRTPAVPRTPGAPRGLAPPTVQVMTAPTGSTSTPTVPVSVLPTQPLLVVPQSTAVLPPGTMLCPHCNGTMPSIMTRCPHCKRAKNVDAAIDDSMAFSEWHRNENTRTSIGWAIAAIVSLIIIIGVWRGLASIGLKPQRIKSEDVRATHSRSVEDAQSFQSRTSFDASADCMRNTGPNYPCSDDGKYIAAVNMVSGDDILEITLNDEWKELTYDARLDYAKTMLNRWRKIHAPLQAKLRLLDRDGNEIGGRSLSGAVWVAK